MLLSPGFFSFAIDRQRKAVPPRRQHSARIINFRLASTRQDQSRLRELARQTFELLERPPMAAITESATAGTSRRSITDLRDDEALDTWIADECIEFHHPCGTCKMGDSDQPDVVVDPSCNVLGIDRLRVADASIFPNIPRANTNLAAIMVGEHVATLVARH
jgi:choline dehydrogenase